MKLNKKYLPILAAGSSLLACGSTAGLHFVAEWDWGTSIMVGFLLVPVVAGLVAGAVISVLRKSWGGVLGAGAFAVAGALLYFMVIAPAAQREHILEVGVPAQARVVTLGGTGTIINRVPVLRIKLEVIPSPTENHQGPAVPYAAELEDPVPAYATPRVQPGATTRAFRSKRPNESCD